MALFPPFPAREAASPVLPYRVEAPVVSREDAALLTWVTKTLVAEVSPGAGTLEAFTLREFTTRLAEPLLEALWRVTRALQVDPVADREVLALADRLHLRGGDGQLPRRERADGARARAAVVLATGPTPYVLSVLEDGAGQDTDPRVLLPGDLVLYDPTARHAWHPARPRHGAFLALLTLDWPAAAGRDLRSRYPAWTGEPRPGLRHLRLVS